MKMRTAEEIKAYVDGYNACYKMFRECLKGRKSVMDAIRKMDMYKAAVNATIEGGEDERKYNGIS